MKSQVLIISAFLVALLAALGAEGRDLNVQVVSGTVQSKDTFTSDPYMSVSVCKQKERTPVINLSRHPTWNWSHNVWLYCIYL